MKVFFIEDTEDGTYIGHEPDSLQATEYVHTLEQEEEFEADIEGRDFPQDRYKVVEGTTFNCEACKGKGNLNKPGSKLKVCCMCEGDGELMAINNKRIYYG